MKRINLLIILLSMAVAGFAQTIQYSGDCGANGSNVQWSFNAADSTLTFTGSGDMKAYSEVNLPPWYRHRAGLRYVVFPNGLTSIGKCALYNCTKVTSVTIPSTVTTLGVECFFYTSITSITIPAAVTSIGSDALQATTLTSITVASANTKYASAGGVLFNKAKTTIIVYPPGKTDASYTIPSTVTSIAAETFRLSKITSITIPASVTSIGNSAFTDSKNLQSITVNSNNPNYCSVNGVLFNKAKTILHTYPAAKSGTSYTIPSTVTTIAYRAFVSVSALQSITIPSSVTTLSSGSFWQLPKLTYLNIPASVTSIGYGVGSQSMLKGYRVAAGNANYCSVNGVLYNKAKTLLVAYPRDTACTSFTVPSTVTIIELGAFIQSTRLKTINLPSRLKTIRNRAFQLCSSLVSINIPASVDSLGSKAFGGCTRMLDIVMNKTTPPTVGTDVFYDSYDKKLAVPCGAKAAYQANSIFGQFASIIEQCLYDVTVTSANATMGSASGGGTNIRGGSVIELTATPNAGYKFSRWSDGSTANPRDFLVECDTTVVASFAKQSYTLTTVVSPADCGTVTAGGTIQYGATKTLKATPAAGYKFSKWTVSGTGATLSSTTSATTTFTMGTANATVTATFVKQSYTLTTAASPAAGGTVTAGGTIQYGSTKTLTATAAPDYAFSNWTITGTAATLSTSTEPTTTFTMGTANATVTAVFTYLGHDWAAPSYRWNADSTQCTATRICNREASHTESETATASIATTPATCLNTGLAVYTASFTNTAFATQVVSKVLPALSHDWDAPSYEWNADSTRCTATRYCRRDANHIEQEIAVADIATTPASCTADGMEVRTASFANSAFSEQTLTKVLPQLQATAGSITAEGLGSLSVNGTVYTQSGTYTQTLTNRAGCDSLLTINATVHQADELSIDVAETFSTCEYEEAIIVTGYAPDTLRLSWYLNGVEDRNCNGTTYYIPNTAPLHGTVTVKGQVGPLEVSRTIRYTIRKRIIMKLWSDVVTIVDPEHGYNRYAWYRDGNAIGSDAYYCEQGGLNGTYYLVATTPSGDEVISCEETYLLAAMRVYPNPTSDYLYLENGTWETGDRILITDPAGRTWYEGEVEQGATQLIDLSAFPCGMYMIHVGNQVVKAFKK